MKLVGRAVDLFGDTMADSRNLMGATASYPVADARFDLRADNVIAYISPNWTGFTAIAAAYAPTRILYRRDCLSGHRQ